MERPRLASEASFSFGERSAEVTSWPPKQQSEYGDYSSLSGYRSSLSLYDKQPSFHSESMAMVGHGHAHSLPGGYPYSSSYGDHASVEASPHLPLENGLGQHPHGHLGGFSYRSSYGDHNSIGSSAHRYESAFSHQNKDMAFSGQYLVGQYQPDGDGPSYSIRHNDLLYQQPGDRYPAQKHDFSYPLKEDNLHHPLSAASYQYLKDDGTGLAHDYERRYLQNSGLERQYAVASSGIYESAVTMREWMGTGSGIAQKGHEGEEGSRSGYGGWLSGVQGRYADDKAGSSFKVMDGNITAEVEHCNKKPLLMPGTRDEGSFRSTQPVMPLATDKGNAADLMHTKPAILVTRDGNNREGSGQAEGAGSATKAREGKKRQSRWEPQPEGEGEVQDSTAKQKKKSRWSPEKPSSGQINLPGFMKDFSAGLNLDPEFLALKAKLVDINRKLLTGQVVEDKPDGTRSPSPEPVYDNFGNRINTREYRAREKLTRERQSVLANLLKKCPSFKAPSDFKSAKLSRKVYIPVEQYPDYNFIGLIIGPRGHTQKRMEKETGAKIFIRGKGSVKEGSSHAMIHDEDDKLHVLIEADSEDSLNMAAGMVEKLLIPVGDGKNELKMAQLRELAALKGTLRVDELCHLCKKPGHYSNACPMNGSTPGSVLAVPGPQKVDSLQSGGGGHGLKSSNVTGSGFSDTGVGLSGGSLGLQLTQSLSQHGIDSGLNQDTGCVHLYVAYLPPSVDDASLLSLFSPFGHITHAKVIKDLASGASKGYGFVRYLDAADAAQAVALMNGYKLDGKVLSVKFKTSTQAGASGSISPSNPDQQQSQKQPVSSSAIQGSLVAPPLGATQGTHRVPPLGATAGSLVAPPVTWNGTLPPSLSSFTLAANPFGGLLPAAAPWQGGPPAHFVQHGGTHQGSVGQ